MGKRKLLFRGTGTALVTPFKKDGSVDEVVLRELVERQILEFLHGLREEKHHAGVREMFIDEGQLRFFLELP